MRHSTMPSRLTGFAVQAPAIAVLVIEKPK
jgi:hypothetical protein